MSSLPRYGFEFGSWPMAMNTAATGSSRSWFAFTLRKRTARISPFSSGMYFVTTVFQIGSIFLFANTRSCMMIEARTKFLGLPMHVEDELRPVDSIREAGIIFHQCGSRELPTWLPTLQDQRIQVRARRVDSRRQSGATASSNDHLLHR